MGIQRLDHVNLRTGQLSAMLQWYGDVLGLHSGPRPDFPFAGAWLYAGEVAVIHLIDIGCLPAFSSDASLRLEHFSLAATDIEAFEARLAASRTHYQRIALAGGGLVQLHMRDPDGNHLHLDFATAPCSAVA
ncbi:VOC family protein [Cobetia amphilecti]|uniref:VOC domain-containing protein n=1 Tax=Cobetia amphilecti TaxID=1055104 RepID=A0AAP4TXV7_9GAMM|nr:VOC family protein [Cobetia amphilecti]MDO6671695.1 hypothetical protein [Cobetia amphilecti]